MINSSISHSICLESNKLYKNSVGEYPYALKLAHNNCKISNNTQDYQLNIFTLNQKDEDMNFIVVLLKKLTSDRDRIKTFRARKLYPNSSYPLCGDYNLTKISLKQKDENMQKVSRPTAHLQQNHANGVVYVS